MDKKIEKIFNLYEKFGQKDYIGENVSQIEHMTQSAMLAEKDGYSKDIILGCFFHDIGHLLEHSKDMDGFGVMNHEKLGSKFIKDLGFPEITYLIIENHVSAKRYLCWKDSNYLKNLSSASKKTLEYQGGVMSEEEAKKYEDNKNYKLFLKIRKYDELSKVIGQKINNLEYYKNMCREVLNN